MEHEAIYQLYPNVKNIEYNGVDYICLDENKNPISIDMSAVNVKAAELQTEADNTKQAKADTKASAKAKLIAGEALTEAEADTIVL